METLWFMIVAVMVAAYVVLDGFDLGAGAIYLGAARTSDERRKILRAIGPVWDGNEVWLLAAGGTLYFAFPLLYASSFSGFYLPLMMVLWLLMLRGIGIELRAHIEHRVWMGFFDLIFCVSSILLAIFFGAALGNVVRGVPLAADGYFFEPLWTNFRVGANTGILDWYTILTGVIALVTLTAHGSLYIAVKTEHDLRPARPHRRAVGLAAAVGLDHRRPGCDHLHSPHSSRQLQTPCHRISHSRSCLRQSQPDDLRHPQRPGQTCLRRFGPLHRRNAGGRGLRSLSCGLAVEQQSRLQPDHLQHRRRTPRPHRRVHVVDHRHGSRSRLLHFSVPHVSRQSAARRGGLLRLRARHVPV